ncbi:MAG: hypothetical protein Q9220_004266 [cf. Caloplaca sp. 1 TL-2023]
MGNSYEKRSSVSPEGSVMKVESEEALDSEGTSSDLNDEPAKPWSVLLQALNPKSSRSEPSPKRQKLDRRLSKSLDHTRSSSVNDNIPAQEDEVSSEEDDGNESDQVDATNDAFSHQFVDQDDDQLLESIQKIKENQWITEKAGGSAPWVSIYQRPSLTGENERRPNRKDLVATNVKLKSKLANAAEKLLNECDDMTSRLASSILNYEDVRLAARSLQNADLVRRLISLHVLNHIFRTRDKVLKNNAKQSRYENDENVEYRDQGFTRPKVLILLPTRQSCVKMVNAILGLCQPEQQENKKRFQDTYDRPEEQLTSDRPEDFQDLFGGNDDDMFRLGLKLTRKTVKFFSQFYSSDIILASPLGLRTALEGGDSKKQDYDFLSSIEVVVADQCEALLMQNWEHLEYVFEHLNLQPKEAHGCDFGRVRHWYLDGHAKYLRQTLLFSAFDFPALAQVSKSHMLNIAGKTRISRTYDGAIAEMQLSMKQTFYRFDYTDPVSEPDARFNYFTTAILPSLIKASSQKSPGPQGALIFIPSYADFVRLRNHLASASSAQHVSFGSISEYIPPKEVARARSHFLTGRHTLLLYTERAHHFRRYFIKGVKQVILYGLPENPVFYKEIVGDSLGASIEHMGSDARHANVQCLFSKLDILKLERAVGTKRYLSLLSEHEGLQLDKLALRDLCSLQSPYTENIWDKYFTDNSFRYQGLDKDWLQRSSEEEAPVPSHILLDQLYPEHWHSRPDKFGHECVNPKHEDGQITPMIRKNLKLIPKLEVPADMSKRFRFNHSTPPIQDRSNENPDKIWTRACDEVETADNQDQTDVIFRRYEREAMRTPKNDYQSQDAILGSLKNETDDLLPHENGFQYEPYEGRAIMHYGAEKVSLGLIIEDPMEERFLPPDSPRSPTETAIIDRAQMTNPQAAKANFGSLYSATGQSCPAFSESVNIPVLPPVSTPGLQRPISPATSVSRRSTLHLPSSTAGHKGAISNPAKASVQPSKTGAGSFPVLAPSKDSQLDLHPAFRATSVLPQAWSKVPIRSQSIASFKDEVAGHSHSFHSRNTSFPSELSGTYGNRPVRKDSLGAPTLPERVDGSEKDLRSHFTSSIESGRTDAGRTHARSGSWTSYLSPSTGHEHTPSVFLCDSTPSTVSFHRTSTSSYGDASPQHLDRKREEAVVKKQDNESITSFQSEHDHDISGHSASNEDPLSSCLSYYTAAGSASELSQPLPVSESARVTPTTSFGGPRNNSRVRHSSFFPKKGHHRSPASDFSRCKTLHDLPLGPSIDNSSHASLNGNAFETADTTMHDGAEYAHVYDAEEERYQFSNHFHGGDRIDAIASKEVFDQEDGTRKASGIRSIASIHKRLPSLPSFRKTSTLARADSDSNPSTSSSTSSARQPMQQLRRHLLVQQNLCSHIKLQSILGVPLEKTKALTTDKKHLFPSTVSSKKRQEKPASPVLGVVRKESQKFWEGGANLVERMKAGWRVRQEDWLDSDDGR